MGQTDEIEFDRVSFGREQSSTFNEFPTRENPDVVYRYGSVYIELSQHLSVIERATYSFLEWLGDIGGLMDALKYIAFLSLGPISAFSMKALLL